MLKSMNDNNLTGTQSILFGKLTLLEAINEHQTSQQSHSILYKH